MSTQDTEQKDTARTIILVGYNTQLTRYLQRFGDVVQLSCTNDVPSDDFIGQCMGVVFGGGDDVPYDLYDEEEGEHKRTQSYSTNRTLFEIDMFDACQRAQVPTLGICRGAQLLCVMSGGKLVQHVLGHQTSHEILVRDLQSGTWCKKPVRTSSTHHQMMMPFVLDKEKYSVLAKASERLSSTYERGPKAPDYTEEEMLCEPEIVMFGGANALCIQGHPEYTFQCSDEFIEYCDTCIRTHFSIR